MQKKFTLRKIKPNPFRDMNSYPINREKIQTLIESYKRTGYWGNIVGRESGTNEVEIAYGHHRLVSMQESMEHSDQIEIIVKQLSDADMLRIMADENMTEWSTNSRVEQETVRAVVLAYAAGKIELPKVAKKVQKINIRYAPHFKRGCYSECEEHPYTDETVAEFLGWKKPSGQPNERIRNALAVLEEAEALDAEEDFQEMTDGLKSAQAKEVVQMVRNVKKAHEAKGDEPKQAKRKAIDAGKRIADKVRKEEAGIRDIRSESESYMPSKPIKKLPDIDEFVELFKDQLDGLLRDDKLGKEVKALLSVKEHITRKQKESLIGIFNGLIGRCQQVVESLNSGKPSNNNLLLETK